MKNEDKELLVLAAKAAGITLIDWNDNWADIGPGWRYEDKDGMRQVFNSLDDDGDTLRLAAILCMDFRWDAHDSELRASCTTQGRLGHRPPGWEVVIFEKYTPEEIGTTAPYRRAATRLAATIGLDTTN